MSISDAISVIQTVLAVGAFIFAYQEFKQWRVETLGSKKIDLALRLGKTAIAIRDAFREARNPARFAIIPPEYKPGSTAEEKKKQLEEYDYNQRLQRIQERLEPLYEIRWEVSVLFADNEGIDEQVKLFNAKFHELQTAMLLIYQGKQKEAHEDILMAGYSGTDEFGKAVDTITDNLLRLAHKYAR